MWPAFRETEHRRFAKSQPLFREPQTPRFAKNRVGISRKNCTRNFFDGFREKSALLAAPEQVSKIQKGRTA